MTSWDYRVLHDGQKYWVGEVYYENDKPESYTGGAAILDFWGTLEDLAATFELAGGAFEKPCLRVKDGKIVE